MLKRNLLAAFILLLFSLNCFSQFYVISNHAIEISVDVQGSAQVSERFFLRFQNQEQLLGFREKASEIGVSLDGWKAYDARLQPYIGRGDVAAIKVAFVENSTTYLEMTYALQTPLMKKTSETSRVIEYAITPQAFDSFLSGSLWVIPENTAIAINLPPEAELQQPIEPEAEVSGNSVTWSGYKNSNKLTLNYRIFKQIASFDFGEAFQQLMQSDWFWVVVVAICAVSLVLFWKRGAIGGRIENYIIEHSDLSEEEEE